MERNSTVKTILLICAAVAALASPAAAQRFQTEARDGVRYLVPAEESTQTEFANLIQSRAMDMGFFSWPIPTEKVAADHANRPRQVSNCSGHDPDYIPAHELGGVSDWRLANTKIAKAFIYEWMAYGNAIKAKDCTCDTLKADWSEAVSAFDTLTEGVENFRLFTKVPGRMRDQIKHDYDRMCDITMLLELE
ncbi:hypothetical protein SAMN05444339_11244 [Loktanella atrilutea]|uniref:Uncharacterized protein n=1 Tax=Loktanella atrilutea TaxID=366533 RepID=A0A1M5ECR8_LOKAT|nr:hypothetical protein SAMN05444339_11244 [Loktanella atrilutea]